MHKNLTTSENKQAAWLPSTTIYKMYSTIQKVLKLMSFFPDYLGTCLICNENTVSNHPGGVKFKKEGRY